MSYFQGAPGATKRDFCFSNELRLYYIIYITIGRFGVFRGRGKTAVKFGFFGIPVQILPQSIGRARIYVVQSIKSRFF